MPQEFEFDDLQEIGGYEIHGRVGEGAFGIVFRGEKPDLQRTAAIKILKQHSEKAKARFRNEARKLVLLNHPGIVFLFDAVTDSSPPFLVSRFVEGPTLSGRLEQEIPLSLPEVLSIGSGLAAALSHAHGEGVVHCDIKPANIMLDEHNPVLVDFSIAASLDPTGGKRKALGGSPRYMSPEQENGQEVDHRTDIFSLGVVLKELLDASAEHGVSAAMIRTRLVGFSKWMTEESAENRPQSMDIVEQKLKRIASIPRSVAMTGIAMLLLIAGLIVSNFGFAFFRGHELDSATRSQASDTDGSHPFEDQITKNSLGMSLVFLRASTFDMGAADTDGMAYPDERPQRRVTITKPFWLGQHEVTVGEYRQFVADGGPHVFMSASNIAEINSQPVWHHDLSEPPGERWVRSSSWQWDRPPFEQNDNHPVSCVSWVEATAFCKWLSGREGHEYRLPTEAQWEYACQEKSTGPWSTGHSLLKANANFLWCEPFDSVVPAEELPPGKPIEVGSLKPNMFGLFDMHGNVMEFTCDRYIPDCRQLPVVNEPIDMTPSGHPVSKGGCWHFQPEHCRTSYRFGGDGKNLLRHHRSTSNGFRIVRLASPDELVGDTKQQESESNE